MAYRSKMTGRGSARSFSRGTRTHAKNLTRGWMRGGIRL